MQDLKKIVDQYPNDMELGKVIRKLVKENIDITKNENSNSEFWYIREHID
jgi:hypothetical protein